MLKISKLSFFTLAVMLTMVHSMNAQFGYGFTASNDLYHRYVNKADNLASPSAGSALLNLGVGPKIWIGNKKVSFSAEAQAVIGFVGLSGKDYKGLGTAAFPILAKINFKGLSTFDREGLIGFSLGGGIQYNKTEIFGLHEEFIQKGVSRSFFPTYIIQAGCGFGLSGFSAHGIIRYGFDPDNKTSTLNVGLQYDFNMPMLKKISNPESAL
ncbi:MAG: hypothetical protein IPN89_17010 [Saprospiraceae bacterium]|nr:hypothetical protein [Saprospiraceae bacterium]